ncbi:Rrf2 family transcriptional regulator [Paenibacillus sp. BSR1-1]|uniref:RrF2 family transcriptional regulator n=1 Tax=Paenibacillus sp. BSR1-1 TaxID=3020845 RepID=UPI0025AF38A0|nr:Rrf2 family transcriptional regulator [Paenibacillus sp. BSR1-1]MDN3020160.1 Rrf2 family transcriptional regulator [Paenibacillus sp. BSR1-1]
MKIKTGLEQAVYALLLLNRLPKHAMLSGESLSEKLHVSSTYLQKLMRKLVQAGLVSSVPGVKGGFRLLATPEDIQIYDVYVAVEGVESLYHSNGVFHAMFQLAENKTCLLSDVMEEAEHAWQSVLKRTTLASLHQALNNTSTNDCLTKIDSWLKERVVL